MEFWFSELHTGNVKLSIKIEKQLFSGESEYQRIDVFDSEEFGKFIALDGEIVFSEKDEFIYDEMVTHVPMAVHPCVKDVLIIGGGDGGVAREVCRHESVTQVDLCEIDERVIELSKEYFPTISKVLLDPPEKLHVRVGDGIAYTAGVKDFYDVIIIDCSDPIGPGEGLFTREFYKSAFEALRKDGLIVQQSESPIVQQHLVRDVHAAMKDVFPIVRCYLASVPIYPECMHSFMLASKVYDPLTVDITREAPAPMRYYNKNVQKAAFALPNYVKDCLAGRGNCFEK